MGRVRTLTLAGLMVAALSWSALSCRSGAPRPAETADASKTNSRAALRVIGPARLIPDVAGATAAVVDVMPDGTRRLLVSGMRVLDHPDGSLDRAREVLSGATTRVLELPARFGGGLLIFSSSGSTTQLWRARSWLDRLDPLVEVWGQIVEVIPGFDRLYARLDTGDFKAIDVQSGKQLPLEPLPRATRIGLLAFADAWRAVAVVDFRGALATFDAGASWRVVPVGGRSVTDLWLREGDFVLQNQRERWLLGPAGELARDETVSDAARALPVGPADSSLARRRGLLTLAEGYGSARRPLRAAVEDGWPAPFDGQPDSAVVAQAGSLYRIELFSGSIVEWRSGAFPAVDGACHAIRLGAGSGFVCATLTGGTAIYALEPPSVVREIARYDRPRIVIPSGNGGLVVRGSCAREARVATEGTFCFAWSSGITREVRVPRLPLRHVDVRPVALRDGRAAFVISPSETGGAVLELVRGDTEMSVPLAAPGRDALFRQASWLEGFEELVPGTLSGWLLDRSELYGVRVHLDGKVEVGRTSANVERTSVSGRYALDWGLAGRGAETTDGGMTWSLVDLPSTELPQVAGAVAACGPLGCSRNGWLRVGWGAGRAPDLAPAPAPKASRVALIPPRGIALRCELTGEMAGPASVGDRSAASRSSKSGAASSTTSSLTLFPTRGPYSSGFAPVVPKTTTPSGPLPLSGWTPFRGSPPPSLGAGETGLEAGTDPPVTMQARIYAWGPRGAQWARAAHVQARFDDRFELHGTRSTLPTTAFWTDEDRTADALGLVSSHTVNWAALLDGSGDAALLYAQQGAGRADLYAAAQGEPLAAWRSADGAPLPVPTSFVRLGPTWFFLAPSMASSAWAHYAYRVDGGVVRRLARLPRVAAPAGEFPPKLMRRTGADGGIGILVQGAPGFDQTIRDWYVLPLDPDTGEVSEPIRLVGSDLEGKVPPRCPPDLEAWWVNTDLSLSPAVQIVGPPLASLSAIELRLGLGPDKVCIDSMAARAEGLPVVSGSSPARANAGISAASEASALPLPLAATDSSSGRRWLLRCGAP